MVDSQHQVVDNGVDFKKDYMMVMINILQIVIAHSILDTLIMALPIPSMGWWFLEKIM